MMYGHVFTAPNDLPELPSADLADRGEMGMEWERNRRAWGSGVGNWGILCYTLRQVIGRSIAVGAHADSIGQLSRRGYVGPDAEF